MRFRYRFSFGFVVLLGLMLFFGVLLTSPYVSAAAGDTAVVAVDLVNIRSGPGTGYQVAAQAALGDRLTVLNKSGDWYSVKLNSGLTGWVAGWLVAIETAGPDVSPPVNQPASSGSGGSRYGGEIAVVTGSVVNVRSGPGTGYDVFSQVGLNERLPVLDKSGDWYKVKLSGGAEGWVAGWLVAIETAGPDVSPPVNQPVSSGSGGSRSGGEIAVVTGSVVNVRGGPGTGYDVFSQVGLNERLPVLDKSGDWYKVKLSGGAEGWVAGWLVNVLQPAPAAQNPDNGVPEGSRGSADRPAGEALSLKISQSGGKTNATVEASAPFDYSSFFLNNPDRLVVDLKGVAIGNLPQSTKVNSDTVLNVRAGYYQKDPDITRLVFELSGGAQYVASLSSDQKVLTVQTYIPDISGAYRGKVIAIDPGHGGSDPGAVGSGGTKEKEVNLDIARRVAKILEAQGAKVVLTRSGDQDIDLYPRTDKANNAKADVFVSIHMNANNDKSIGGTTTYIYSGNGDAKQAARIQESGRLARYVQAELLKALGLRDIGVKDANFAVLRTSNMPAVLAEVAFISSAAEEKLMKTDQFRNKVAEAIARGIGAYFAEKRTA
ncbi:MAG: N-acetylmuramoyl-L-alanine amidase AmiC precursor [Pelotomaculum sp. PtaU1.Bin035]|nr:MAG: N-acetylmuramoyl-L-alanine amidase AmiC precursor [Pelotomaculum sp. PtaU1.Bin035]